ncbi:MAG: transporter [Cyclobacteriaceae bacterium]|nr:transporter [Cyclobacteriaceae bacterium]
MAKILSRFKWVSIAAIVLVNPLITDAQSTVDEQDGSDPVSMKSRFVADAEAYLFVGEARHYAMRFGYEYGIQNGRHLFGMSLPFVHTIYNADFGGYENTTGVGDLKMRYMFAPFLQTSKAGLQRVSAYAEVTAPTGEYRQGRGAGTWLFKPGMVFTVRSDPYVSFYPEIKFQLSGGAGNSLGGADGAPDANNPDKDGKIQNLSLALPVVVLVKDWDGWFSLNAMYIRSLTEKVDFIFLRTDFGRMIGDNTSAALNISKFIAGQPRLNVLVQARFQFFLR